VVGETDFEPADPSGYTAQLAAHLTRVHAIPDGPTLAFLPQRGKGFGAQPEQLDLSMHEDRIRAALEAVWPVAQENPTTLLHGDYWPGNVLWVAGELVAIIDWEDACLGDPLVDVANCRMELTMALGEDAAEAFTSAYRERSLLGFANLAYWDLCAALSPCGKLAEWGLEPEEEGRMRAGHAAFVAQGLARLAEH
jgi:aminoglycoside phosphotransferase (APT) family kinase protein